VQVSQAELTELLQGLEQRLERRLSEIDRKLGIIMAAQDDINAAVASLAQTQTALDTSVGAVTSLVPPAP
jgi:hypothetical protein